MMQAARTRRGGPLLMLALLLTAWTAGRAYWWENPFAAVGAALEETFAAAPPPDPDGLLAAALPGPAEALALPAMTGAAPLAALARERLPAGTRPQLAAAHGFLWLAALRQPARRDGGAALADFGSGGAIRDDSAPFLAAAEPSRRGAGGRWSADVWAFWRQGSGAAPVSQGRVPVYGASQAGALLQYRLAPDAAHDPRLYARAYRALVRRGESELALGASARPLGRVPLRLAGEVRVTDSGFGTQLRPAAFAITEIPPLALPFETQLEAYGQAGWVGGAAATPFADGQASLTREWPKVAALTDDAVRLRLGAGAWGGAQQDAQRIDVGPTMRLDLTVGEVPARLSLDWRERVGGEAGPGSGLAATVSARF